MNKLTIFSVIGMIFIVAFILSAQSAVHAQTPTQTPLPTPTGTPVPLSSKISQTDVSAQSVFDSSDWKSVLGIFTGLGNYVDLTSASVDLRTSSPLEIDRTDPLSMARGLVVLLSDFEWLGMLFGWFSFAFLLIIAVEGIRLIVSLWGVVEKIIALIKLIPFV